MPEHEPTTKLLLRRAADGERDAIERLFARAYPDLLQAARFRMGPVLRSRMETLDVAQAAYVEAMRDLGSYEYQGKGSFYHWLLVILENKIRKQIEFLRAKKRDVRREVGFAPELAAATRERGGEPSPTRRLIANEDRHRLEQAMDQLSAIHREVIVLRYYVGMSWREVSICLERSEEASQMLCRRALTRLKSLYGEF